MALSEGYDVTVVEDDPDHCEPGQPGNHDMVRDGEWFTDGDEVGPSDNIYQPMICRKCGHKELWGESLAESESGE